MVQQCFLDVDGNWPVRVGSFSGGSAILTGSVGEVSNRAGEGQNPAGGVSD